MKIRVGFGLGTRTVTNDPERFDPLVDGLERHGFDSLWLSERVSGDCPDPVVGLAYAAGRTRRIKSGMSGRRNLRGLCRRFRFVGFYRHCVP